ncbi:MAG: hypothetical protein ABIE03_05250 [Patescibacteria group bacterium]|nr:hypothetical protein [Patescibacteria group bacterium]
MVLGGDVAERTQKQRLIAAELDAALKRKVEVQDEIRQILDSTVLFEIHHRLRTLAQVPFTEPRRIEDLPFQVASRPRNGPFGLTISLPSFSENTSTPLPDGSRVVHTSITRYLLESSIHPIRSRSQGGGGPEQLHYSIRQVYLVPTDGREQRAEAWEYYYTQDQAGKPNFYSFKLQAFLDDSGSPQIAYMDFSDGAGPVPVMKPDFPRRHEGPFSQQAGISEQIHANLMVSVQEHILLLDQIAPNKLLENMGQGRGEAMTTFLLLRETFSLLQQSTVVLLSETSGVRPRLLPGTLALSLNLANYISDRNALTFPHVNNFPRRIALIKEYAQETEEYQLYIVEDFRSPEGTVYKIMFVPTRLNTARSEAVNTTEFQNMVALELRVVYRVTDDGQEFFEVRHQGINDRARAIRTSSPAYPIVETLCQELGNLVQWPSVDLTHITRPAFWFPVPADQMITLGLDAEVEELIAHEFQNVRRLVGMYEFLTGDNQRRAAVLQQMAFVIVRLIDRYSNGPETFLNDFPELQEMDIPQQAFDLAIQMLT